MPRLLDTHIVPDHDLIDHPPIRQCLCRPQVVLEPNGTVTVIHFAADGRSVWEDGSGILIEEAPVA
jgi:hypothetical protein